MIPYGKGSRPNREPKGVLSREQVLDAMRFLGYVTHDENGSIHDATYKTAGALAGKVKENVMLPVLIAQEYAKHKAQTA